MIEKHHVNSKMYQFKFLTLYGDESTKQFEPMAH